MPYGTISENTRKWIELRAAQSNIPLEKLGLDEYVHTNDCPAGVDEDEDCICNGADNTYEISVIFGEALDESFYVTTDYEVNIADWIAEDCANEVLKQPGESWEVIVTEPNDSGVVRYRVSDETFERTAELHGARQSEE